MSSVAIFSRLRSPPESPVGENTTSDWTRMITPQIPPSHRHKANDFHAATPPLVT